MKKALITKILLQLLIFVMLVGIFTVFSHGVFAQDSADRVVQADESKIGFKIPNLADILTFIIRVFFVIAGLAALLFLLMGAFGWVVSGGDKDAITAARDKIQAAVVGLILIVAVLAIIVTLEKIVFRERICLGVSCPVKIPSLVGSCIPHPYAGGNDPSTFQAFPENQCCPGNTIDVIPSKDLPGNGQTRFVCCTTNVDAQPDTCDHN